MSRKHNIWFTSDTHFGHANVIRYSNRPWTMVNEMNDGIIERWNNCVRPQDTVYHLGDFCLTRRIDVIDEWLGRLNGTIRLVKGNHDKAWVKRYERLENKHKIKWIKDYAERWFEVGGEKYMFVLMHFPILRWNHSQHGSIMLHGHSHGDAQKDNEGMRRMDVGVDCNNWYPMLLENIVAMLKDKGPTLHHGR